MYPIEFSSNLITGEMHTVIVITFNQDSTFLKIGKICSFLLWGAIKLSILLTCISPYHGNMVFDTRCKW